MFPGDFQEGFNRFEGVRFKKFLGDSGCFRRLKGEITGILGGGGHIFIICSNFSRISSRIFTRTD